MILDYNNYKNINFKKYKRVFIFGCSFTNYYWPTWANILAYETPQSTVYNLGISGGGNLSISNQVVSANQYFKFNDDDLILLMWSTYFREDKFIKDNWLCPGNIFSQFVYDDEYIRKYSCVKGYVVRDFALITLTKTFLNSIPSDSIMLKSVDVDYKNKNIFFEEYNMEEFMKLYLDIIEDMPKSLEHFVKNPNSLINTTKTKKPLCNSISWIPGHTYGSSTDPNTHNADYHPNPKMYLEYLLNIGFNLSDDTIHRVLVQNSKLLTLKTHIDIENWFASICHNMKNYYRIFKLF
jgi:hypothetical protein